MFSPRPCLCIDLALSRHHGVRRSRSRPERNSKRGDAVVIGRLALYGLYPFIKIRRDISHFSERWLVKCHVFLDAHDSVIHL